MYPIIRFIQKSFYQECSIREFHKDKNRLLYAITWPATWLEKRHLLITQKHYQEIITERLKDIKIHGDPKRYQPYFPRYLLKVLQDWVRHHEDELYEQLKHGSYTIDFIFDEIKKIPIASEQTKCFCPVLAQAHRLLRKQYKNTRKRIDKKQMDLSL